MVETVAERWGRARDAAWLLGHDLRRAALVAAAALAALAAVVAVLAVAVPGAQAARTSYNYFDATTNQHFSVTVTTDESGRVTSVDDPDGILQDGIVGNAQAEQQLVDKASVTARLKGMYTPERDTDAETGAQKGDDLKSGAEQISDFILGAPDALWNASGENLRSITVSGFTNSFDSLFASDGSGGDAWATVVRGFNAVSSTFGYSVLAIVFLVRLVKMANRLDGSQSVPGVKEVLFLLVLFTVFMVLVDNAGSICAAIYNVFNDVAKAISPGTSSSIEWSNPQHSDDLFVSFLQGLFLWLATIGVQIAVYFSLLGRALQIYVFTIFSPIPLSFLMLDETRSWGVGFFKNFIALCLAGSVILVCLVLFPPIVSGVAATTTGILGWPAMMGCCLVMIVSLVRSGSLARDVMGG